MSTRHHRSGTGHASRTKFWLRSALLTAAISACSTVASAATITVNSLLDDVFPDAAGAIPVPLTAPKCTLRMAIASANPDLPLGGADSIVFDAALANGTLLLDATQAMSASSPSNILYISSPSTIDGRAAVSITLDGGSDVIATNKRILGISESPAAGATLAGSSICVNLYSLNFQNARVESAGACVLSFENLSIFSANFTNCIATNTPTVAQAAGGALFMRAPDNAASAFRPDARLTRVYFKGNKALAGGSTGNPGGGAFYLRSGSGRMGNVVLTDVAVGGPNAADQNYADGGYSGGSIIRAEYVSGGNSTFQGNVALNNQVGGLRIDSMSGEGTATVFNSSFTANSANNGGALSITNNTASPVILRNLIIDGNTRRGDSGLNLRGNRSIVLSNSSISDNVETTSQQRPTRV